MSMTRVSHNFAECCRDDAYVNERVSQLKLLCGLLPKPIDKQRCLEAILRLRSTQHAALMNAASGFAGANTPSNERDPLAATTRLPAPGESPDSSLRS